MTAAGPTTAPAIVVAGVTKSFGTVIALGGVDFDVRAGEVHALIGENGAGKTTLMRVLAGLDTPDAGTVAIVGRAVTRFDPRTARQLGVALVQQHFTLVPRFTAAENLVLARPRGWRLPSRRDARRRVTELAERYELPVRVDVPAAELSVGEQQRLELLRALDTDPGVLLLDEPTAVLTEDEADRLLTGCRRLTDEGRAVVIISHRLREVVDHADRVTVLRAGAVVLRGSEAAGHNRGSLTQAMIGAAPTLEGAAEVRPPAVDVRLSLNGVRLGRLDRLDLEVRAGEIVAIAGVDGNGQAELEAVVSGRVEPAAGEVLVGGSPLANPRQRVAAGVAYVAADRYRYGLVRAMTYGDNLDLGRSAVWRPPRSRREADARGRLDQWDVRGPRKARAGQLSGGNAQKLVLAREFAGAPSVVIACHPTRGLDPGAASVVARRIVASAAGGAAVLWIGAELDELLAAADRLVVLCTGCPPASFGPPWDRHAIGTAMAGLDAAPSASPAPEPHPQVVAL